MRIRPTLAPVTAPLHHRDVLPKHAKSANKVVRFARAISTQVLRIPKSTRIVRRTERKFVSGVLTRMYFSFDDECVRSSVQVIVSTRERRDDAAAREANSERMVRKFSKVSALLFIAATSIAIATALLIAGWFPRSANADHVSGEAVYREYCASCHDHPGPRIPPRSALQALSAARILRTLDGGVMMRIAYGLQRNQREAVANYLGKAKRRNRATCKRVLHGPKNFAAGEFAAELDWLESVTIKRSVSARGSRVTVC